MTKFSLALAFRQWLDENREQLELKRDLGVHVERWAADTIDGREDREWFVSQFHAWMDTQDPSSVDDIVLSSLVWANRNIERLSREIDEIEHREETLQMRIDELQRQLNARRRKLLRDRKPWLPLDHDGAEEWDS